MCRVTFVLVSYISAYVWLRLFQEFGLGLAIPITYYCLVAGVGSLFAPSVEELTSGEYGEWVKIFVWIVVWIVGTLRMKQTYVLYLMCGLHHYTWYQMGIFLPAVGNMNVVLLNLLFPVFYLLGLSSLARLFVPLFLQIGFVRALFKQMLNSALWDCVDREDIQSCFELINRAHAKIARRRWNKGGLPLEDGTCVLLVLGSSLETELAAGAADGRVKDAVFDEAAHSGIQARQILSKVPPLERLSLLQGGAAGYYGFCTQVLEFLNGLCSDDSLNEQELMERRILEWKVRSESSKGAPWTKNTAI